MRVIKIKITETMAKIIIGIDPGNNGGISFGYEDGTLIDTTKMPQTPRDILDYLEHIKQIAGYDCNDNVVCYLEKVQGMPGQGGMAMFNFGKGFGYLEMGLIGMNIQTVEVTPQKWQKFFQLGASKSCSSKTEWKNKLKAKAQQLFPKIKVTLWNADALLLYYYGVHTEKGK